MSDDEILPKDAAVIPEIEDFSKMDFDFTPLQGAGKLIFTIHGKKGHSKTYAAFLITTGRIGGFKKDTTTLAVTFDLKTQIISSQWFNTDKIEVHDGKKFYTKDPRFRTIAGAKSFNYLIKLAQTMAPVDWIVIDGFSELADILEMAMRYNNGLRPTQGFANRTLWKERSGMIQAIHDEYLRKVNLGLIYTTYSEKDPVIQNGEVQSTPEIPKYVDVVMRETDVVIKVDKKSTPQKDYFFLKVESTKYRTYPDLVKGGNLPVIEGITLQQGRTYDITDLSLKPPRLTL